jgi:hypothetical protein
MICLTELSRLSIIFNQPLYTEAARSFARHCRHYSSTSLPGDTRLAPIGEVRYWPVSTVQTVCDDTSSSTILILLLLAYRSTAVKMKRDMAKQLRASEKLSETTLTKGSERILV